MWWVEKAESQSFFVDIFQYNMENTWEWSLLLLLWLYVFIYLYFFLSQLSFDMGMTCVSFSCDHFALITIIPVQLNKLSPSYAMMAVFILPLSWNARLTVFKLFHMNFAGHFGFGFMFMPIACRIIFFIFCCWAVCFSL